MAIDHVEIKDFLVFRGEFAVDFCPGLNVLIGANATGKTTLMKVMYGLCAGTNGLKLFSEYFSSEQTENCPRSFDCQIETGNFFVRRRYREASAEFEQSPELAAAPLKAVFIPVAEMLSHSDGLLELNVKYEMPYDRTQIDVLVNAGLPVTREITPNAAKVLDRIGKVIDGEVLYDEDKYYVLKNNGLKVEFTLEASGYQKFGLLWKLLRNGLLESGSVLFWDEPEAGINPDLMSVLVDILLELQRGGVQIFIATHNEILASYFDVNRKDDDCVTFYAFYKDGEAVKADMSDRFDLLEPNHLTNEQVKLYEREVEKWKPTVFVVNHATAQKHRLVRLEVGGET
jgi:predicted ATPase